jgi:hypothetical protein
MVIACVIASPGMETAAILPSTDPVQRGSHGRAERADFAAIISVIVAGIKPSHPTEAGYGAVTAMPSTRSAYSAKALCHQLSAHCMQGANAHGRL